MSVDITILQPVSFRLIIKSLNFIYFTTITKQVKQLILIMLVGTDVCVRMVFVWEVTGVPGGNPPAWLGDQWPSHMPTLGIEPGSQRLEAGTLTLRQLDIVLLFLRQVIQFIISTYSCSCLNFKDGLYVINHSC